MGIVEYRISCLARRLQLKTGALSGESDNKIVGVIHIIPVIDKVAEGIVFVPLAATVEGFDLVAGDGDKRRGHAVSGPVKGRYYVRSRGDGQVARGAPGDGAGDATPQGESHIEDDVAAGE